MPTDAWTLAEWDATETLEHLARKDVTPTEVLEAAITRAQDAAPLNAVVTEAYDRARDRLRTATGPLAGVPSFMKDLVQLTGVRSRWGSAASGHFIPKKSEPTAITLEGTGVSTLGKSATPEFGLTAATEPLGFPPTLNPWNPAHSTGGSSGGAAALVASGVVPIAHASDGGGSIRIPAACCGLVGLKPTRRRFDMEGSTLMPVNLAVNGVLSRTVRDTVLFWRAVEGTRKKNPLPPIGEVTRSGRKLRIGFFLDTPWGEVLQPEVRARAEEIVTLLRELGHQVEPVANPMPKTFAEDFLLYWGFVAFAQMRTAKFFMHKDFETSKFEPWSRAVSGNFEKSKLKALGSMRRLRALEGQWRSMMGGFDVLFCPTLSEPAVRIGELRTDQPYDVIVERISRYSPFTGLANMSGAPALSLPLARAASGLPLGMMFTADHRQEALLLELGLQLEEARPWPRTAPRSAWAPKN